MGLQLGLEFDAFGDGVDFGLVEGAADQQPHAAVVADQFLDAADGESQRLDLEVAGQAVVTDGAFEGGDVEALHQIAVIGRVFQLPGMVTEEAHGRSAT